MSTATFPTITAGTWRMAMIRARSTANEVAQQIKARLAPRMLRRCAWCKAWLPSVPCERAMHGTVSDGMCPACFERTMGELNILRGDATTVRKATERSLTACESKQATPLSAA